MILLVFLLLTCHKKDASQNEINEVKEDINIPREILHEKYQDIVRPVVEAFIKNDKDEIINSIFYPLRRQYPIPNINNRHEMAERYNQVFDTHITNLIKNSSIENSWQDVGWRGISLDSGSVWIDYDGKIIGINHQSLQEKEMRNNIINEMKNNLHESLKDFNEPILLCETENYSVRIDMLYNNNYRLALWTKGKNQTENPDIILTNGKVTMDGSGGDHYYLFNNDDVQYILYVYKLSISYGGYFVIYNGMDRHWYDRNNEKDILVDEEITKIEN
jgi:hypothetical protein